MLTRYEDKSYTDNFTSYRIKRMLNRRLTHFIRLKKVQFKININCPANCLSMRGALMVVEVMLIKNCPEKMRLVSITEIELMGERKDR